MNADHAEDPNLAHVHIVSPKILLGVWAALPMLTVITVAVTWVDLGKLNIAVALLIATVKALLVALYFMHLRWDHPFFGLVLIASLLFVALFIAITLLDSRAYAPGVEGAVGAFRALTVDCPYL